MKFPLFFAPSVGSLIRGFVSVGHVHVDLLVQVSVQEGGFDVVLSEVQVENRGESED